MSIGELESGVIPIFPIDQSFQISIGAFRVTKLRQNSAKMDFSKCDQNKKSLGKTLPKQLFCHWANRAPT